ncbi:MAG: TRAP transporter TatT component family protein [Pseudomonadales bacterium]|nr:TRAP transporter TatT component family protein [Pseudomonadales bacterium]
MPNIEVRTCVSQITILCLLSLTVSCASMMSSVTSGLADDLAQTILNSDDVETVREGIPAYLLMIDSFLRSSPENSDLLLAASNLNGAFSVFTEGQRSQLLTQKSLAYADRAACIDNSNLCGLRDLSFSQYKARIDAIELKHVDVALALGIAWTGWIQAHSADWNAIAQLAKVKYLLSKVIELDETIDQGGAHLYMGGLETILPASMGGRPEKGKVHFERAIKLADGKFLMTKVIYAEQYAKLTFDKTLYDRLLNEVLAADPRVDGMTLTNTLAQQQAKALLAESDDYF